MLFSIYYAIHAPKKYRLMETTQAKYILRGYNFDPTYDILVSY